MNKLVSNRLILAFEGMVVCGVVLSRLFFYFGLNPVIGCLVGTISGGLFGYMIGRKIDLQEEKTKNENNVA